MRTTTYWVGGKYYEGSPIGRFVVENPGTGEVEAELLQASDADLDHAVKVARRAQKERAKVSLAKRTAIMFRVRQLALDHQDEMAKMIVAEHGENYSDAIGKIQRGCETLDFATAINLALKGGHSFDISTGANIHTLRQPVGVIAGICPFNFPAMVPMWMHPIAIVTSNAFVLKPASATPSAALLTTELYREAGLSDGVFNAVSGNRTMVSKVLEYPGIDAISFVGSTPVVRIAQNTGVTHGKRVQALGGANNHAVIMSDSNLDFAAQHISAAASGAAGERCMVLPVVVVVGGCGPDLTRRVKAHAEKIKIGYGMDEGVEMGPVIDAKFKKFITELVDDAEAKGAEVVLDGHPPVIPGHERGHFLGPTTIDNVSLESSLYTEEVFGPVLAIVHADTYKEAVKQVNLSPFGNGVAIFTNDGGMARRFELGVEAGMVGINVPIPTLVAYYPFGGWKELLLGDTHIHGPEGVRFYTRAKAVITRWPSERAYTATMSFQREEQVRSATQHHGRAIDLTD